ncbi:MAG: translation initiation factor eIF-1A [Candidatus Micrarchaeota archaeon]
MEVPTSEPIRIRMPREKDREVLGVVIGVMGGSRMRVACKDQKERMCRIPGKLKNTIWVKDGDVVIIKPWEIQGDIKGDIVWRYNPHQARMLKEKGMV